MKFVGHAGNVNSVGFSQEGRWIFSSSEDKTVKIWDFRGFVHLFAPNLTSGKGPKDAREVTTLEVKSTVWCYILIKYDLLWLGNLTMFR